MRIETFILANNEELLMPYIMRHYDRFSDVIILESNSTDRTKEIAHNLGADVWSYDWPDEVNDKIFQNIKNQVWKGSRADWVIIADADEFIWGDFSQLEKTKFTIIKPQFYDMYSEAFPITEGQIYDEVRMGIQQISPLPKMNIFKPGEIINMNYAPGCHEALPEGNIQIGNPGFKTLHMRYLSKEYVIDKNARHSRRMSEINRTNRWGWHVDKPAELIIAEFDENMKHLTKII